MATPPPRPRRHRRPAVIVAAACAVAGLSGCGTAKVDAPTISVVTSIYPLAQAVAAIGGATVAVVDLAVAGVNPRTQTPSATQRGLISKAAVVVDVGGGFQPALEQATGSATRVVSMSAGLGPQAEGAWLDPVAMEKVLPVIARALSAANPKAAATYANGERDFYEQLASEAINDQSELGDCPKSDIATPDTVLGDLARQYGLKLHVLGASAKPTPAEVTAGAAVVSSSGAAVLAQPWVADGTVKAAAARAGTKVHTFDTLEAPPAGGWPPGSSYISLLATDRVSLTSALGCVTNEMT